MPVLNGPDNFNNQFTVAADGTISLTTPPFSTAGGTISPGPVIITNAASAPQPFPVTAQLNVVSEAGSFVLADTYGTASPGFVSRRARGTAAAPTAVQSGDNLLFLGAWGRGATGYFGTKGQLILSALENWTDTAQGTQFGFLTTSLGTATLANRMLIRSGVVIGNPAPDPGQGGLVLNANAAVLPAPPVASVMQISNVDGTPTRITVEGFASNGNITFRRANGTAAAPTAVAFNDQIGQLSAFGYGATGYCVSSRAGVGIYAAQAWTDTAQGAVVTFTTTPNGTVATAEAMRIDHSGFVGIGTTAPGAPLDVVGGGSGAKLIVRSPPTGAGNAYNDIQVRNDTNSNLRTLALSYTGSTFPGAYWSGGVTGEQGAVGTTGNFPLSFGTNNTARMLIDAAGNVGIGTATPQAKLEVNQNAANPTLYTGAEVTRFAAADSTACIVGAYSFSGAASGSAPGVVLHKKRGTGAAPTATQLGDNVGFITWNNFDGTNEHQAATINVTAAENTTSTNAGGILNFNTAGIGQTSVTQRMVIDGNGYVGIGTTAPGARLHVGASATSGGQENLGSTVLLTAPNDGNAPLILQRSGVVNPQMMNFGVNQASHWSEIQSAQSNVGFTNLLLNQSGGNVGIGTTTPGEKLEIAGGGLKIDGQLAANRASCIGIEQPSTTMSRIICWGPDVNTLGTFQLLQQSSTAAHQAVAVQVNNLGYVGIGTTTANSPLTVAGNVEIVGGSGSSTLLNIHYTGSQWIASATGTGGIVGLDSNGLVFYSNPSGTVGTAVVPTMKMAVRNDGTCANTSGAWGVISDASIKENVQPYTRGLDAIVALKPVQFRYVKGTPFAEPDKPSRQLFGLLADEVKPHVPEIVGTMMATVGKKEGVELATLEPGNLIYALINAVKELHAKVAALESATVH